MMKELITYSVTHLYLIFGVYIFFCQCTATKIPVEVQVVEEDSLRENITVKIYVPDGQSFQLKLSKAPNIWSENLEISSVRKSGKRIDIEKPPISNADGNYVDLAKHSVLHIDGNNVNGIVDDNHTIMSENGKHFLMRNSIHHHDNKEKFSAENENIQNFHQLRSLKLKSDDIEKILSSVKNIGEIAEPKVGENIRTTRMISNKSIPEKNHIQYRTINVFAVVDKSLVNILKNSAFPIKNGNDSFIYSYIGLYWAAVKQVFASMPWINIKLGDILIDSDSLFTPVYYHRNSAFGRLLIANHSLNKFGNFVTRNSAMFSSYDIVVWHTSQHMITRKEVNIKGHTYLGGMCKQNAGVAIAYDNGNRDFLIGARVVAQNLGAPRDGSLSHGTFNCPWTENNVMGRRIKDSLRSDIRSKLSRCSKAKIQEYLNTEKCSKKQVSENRIDLTIIYSKYMDLNAQCVMMTGLEEARFVEPKDQSLRCSTMVCVNWWDKDDHIFGRFDVFTTYKYPFDGTPCASNKSCLKGNCVAYDINPDHLATKFQNFEAVFPNMGVNYTFAAIARIFIGDGTKERKNRFPL